MIFTSQIPPIKSESVQVLSRRVINGETEITGNETGTKVCNRSKENLSLGSWRSDYAVELISRTDKGCFSWCQDRNSGD